MPKVQRCPTCNSRIKIEDYRKRIEKKRLARDKLTLSMIDEVFDSISLHHSLSEADRFSFYSETEEIQDIVVRKMIRHYVEKQYHKQGYSLRYLIGMVKNENSAYSLKKEYERKSLDRIPPKIDK